MWPRGQTGIKDSRRKFIKVKNVNFEKKIVVELSSDQIPISAKAFSFNYMRTDLLIVWNESKHKSTPGTAEKLAKSTFLE